MIRVNLAETAKRQAVTYADTNRVSGGYLPVVHLLIFAAALAGGYLWYHSLTGEAARLTASIKSEGEIKTRLAAVRKTKQEIETQKKAREARLIAVRKLKTDQVSPVVALDKLAEAIRRTDQPDKKQYVWLSRMDQNNTSFSMTGISSSVSGIADFIANLEATGYFSNITQLNAQDNAGNYNFTLTCDYTPQAARLRIRREPTDMAVDLKIFNRQAWYAQVAIVAAICGVLLAGFWYQFLQPIQIEVAAQSKLEQTLKKENTEMTEQLKDLPQLRREAEALRAELVQLKRDLPLEKETHQILEDIQDLVGKSALKIRHVGPRATVDRDFYTEWPWEFEVVGTFHNIGLFLDRVRNLDRIVSVSNLKISGRSAAGPESRTASVGATYTATTYVYREEQEPEPAKK